MSHDSSEPKLESLAAALNSVIDDHAEVASQLGKLFSFKIACPLPTWVVNSNLEKLKLDLATALEKNLRETEGDESQVEARLELSELTFYCRNPQKPKDHRAARLIFRTDITPASNRETFTGLLSQARGKAALGNIKTLLRGLHFLVADDSLDSQELAIALITDLGGEAEGANDGEEAVRKAMSGEFDLVLMDIRMPGVDGNTAMKTLLEKGYAIPVIAVSGASSREEREESFRCGFKDYLTKPFQADQLIRTILRLTKRPIPIAGKPPVPQPIDVLN